PRTASPVATGSDRVPRLAVAVGPGPRTGSGPDHARADAGPGTGSDLPAGRRVPRADRHVVAGGPGCRHRPRFGPTRCPPTLGPRAGPADAGSGLLHPHRGTTRTVAAGVGRGALPQRSRPRRAPGASACPDRSVPPHRLLPGGRSDTREPGVDPPA